MSAKHTSSPEDTMTAVICADGFAKLQGFVTLETFFREAARYGVEIEPDAKEALLSARNHGRLERPQYGVVRTVAARLSRAGTVLEAQYAIGAVCGASALAFDLGEVIDMAAQMMYVDTFKSFVGTSLFWSKPLLDKRGFASIPGFCLTKEGIRFGLYGGEEARPAPYLLAFHVPDNISLQLRRR